MGGYSGYSVGIQKATGILYGMDRYIIGTVPYKHNKSCAWPVLYAKKKKKKEKKKRKKRKKRKI